MPFLKPKQYDSVWINQGIQLNFPTFEELSWLQTQDIMHSKRKERALLMLHGFSSSPAVFRHMYSELSHYDKIYAPTLPGHGVSIKDFSQVTHSQWLQKARQSYQGLAQTYEKVDVLGLSLGGLLACHLAQEFNINRLFLLAPALALCTSTTLLLRTAKLCKSFKFKNLRNMGGNTVSSEANELLLRQLPLTTIIEILRFIQEFKFKLWDTPTELFLGTHDLVVHSPTVEKILKPLPQIIIHHLNHSAHVLPIDNDKDYIIKKLKQYD